MYYNESSKVDYIIVYKLYNSIIVDQIIGLLGDKLFYSINEDSNIYSFVSAGYTKQSHFPPRYF